MKKTLLSMFLLVNLLLKAQAPFFSWAKSIGSASDEVPNTVLSDAAGNIFVLGNYNSLTDFDPGPGTYTMAPASGNVGVFLLKLDATGNFVWARSFGSEAAVGMFQASMSLDPAGNIVIVGMYVGVADFDPGPATHNLSVTMGNPCNSYVLKLDANGNFMWVKDFRALNQNGGSIFSDVKVDGAGNIYVVGHYSDQFDYDPDPVATYTLPAPTTQGNYSYAVLKLNSAGNFVWVKTIDSPIYTASLPNLSLTTDQQGNVLFSGSYTGTVDFDPGAGNHTLTSGSTSPTGSSFVTKLDGSGNFVWACHTDCPGGTWVTNKDLVCDNAGNVYVCGWSAASTTDLDPGPAVLNPPFTTAAEQGYFFKLDPAGSFVWGNFIGGDNSSNCASLAFNTNGDLMILGDYAGTFDFDGGPGTFILTTTSSLSNDREPFICSYSAGGTFLWAEVFGGATGGSAIGKSIAADNVNIYAVGSFEVTADYDPTAGTSTLTNVSGRDTYILKLSTCLLPPSPTNATPAANRSVCAGATATLSVNTSTGTVSWYASPTATTAIGSGTVYVTPALAAGTYSYYADATTCAPSIPRTVITVTAITLPVITASTFSSTICSGSTVTLTASAPSAVSYSWSTGASTASITVSPTVTTTYTVKGTNACGTASASVTQYVYNCTGIHELTNAGDISVYPNPASDGLSIAIPTYLASESTILEVSDALGKLVMRETLGHEINTFNISMLEDGMYFFRVTNNKQTIKVDKVVKH